MKKNYETSLLAAPGMKHVFGLFFLLTEINMNVRKKKGKKP